VVVNKFLESIDFIAELLYELSAVVRKEDFQIFPLLHVTSPRTIQTLHDLININRAVLDVLLAERPTVESNLSCT
jgi:hypothetical protein